jgi:hypothetical protein
MTVATYMLRPAVTKRRGSLLDAVTPTEVGFRGQDGTDLWDSYNCMKFDSAAAFCAPNNKTFDKTANWIDGFRFAVYGGVICKAIGLDQANMESEVEAAFRMGESTAVEQALMATRFRQSPILAAGEAVGDRWPVPTDITPAAGAQKPATAIGMLEGHAGRNYVGSPTLHMPIVVASMILGVDGAMFEGDVLTTKFGSKIAAGAGYDYPNLGPTGAAAAVGEKWVYATGGVAISHSKPVIKQVMNHSTNEVLVLAERGYIAAVDCYAAAIRVSLT